jgi:hypothetical protein
MVKGAYIIYSAYICLNSPSIQQKVGHFQDDRTESDVRTKLENRILNESLFPPDCKVESRNKRTGGNSTMLSVMSSDLS